MAAKKYDKRGAEARRRIAHLAADQKYKFKAEWRGYVNFSPSQEQKAIHDAWCHEVELGELLHESCNRGEKVSLYWDERAASYVASIFVRDEDSVNAGLILTARANEPTRALFRVFFYALNCLPEDWSAHVAQRSDDW